MGDLAQAIEVAKEAGATSMMNTNPKEMRPSRGKFEAHNARVSREHYINCLGLCYLTRHQLALITALCAGIVMASITFAWGMHCLAALVGGC